MRGPVGRRTGTVEADAPASPAGSPQRLAEVLGVLLLAGSLWAPDAGATPLTKP